MCQNSFEGEPRSRLTGDPPANQRCSSGAFGPESQRPTLGGSALSRLGWLKRQVTRAIAHGPAGIPNLTITANPLGLRPESDARTRSVKIWAGPSRRPSGINALTFGRAKITLRALYRDSSATAGWEQTTNSAWPGGSRGRRSEFKANDGRLSPANRPARKLGANPRGEITDEQNQS